MAEYGARLIVSSRKIDDCERVAQEIRDAGGQATAIACNIGDLAQIEQLIERIKTEFGRLDICVNNAATNPYFGHVLDTDLGAFQKTVDVNIRGYFFMSVEAGKIMRDQGSGVIVKLGLLLLQWAQPSIAVVPLLVKYAPSPRPRQRKLCC